MRIKENLTVLMPLVVLILVMFSGAIIASPNAVMAASISEGSTLPEFKMDLTSKPDMLNYLGIESGTEFSLFQITAKLIVIEFFSVVCPACLKNAPNVNKLYDIISNDADLNKDVKLVGIAVGNDDKLVNIYKNKFDVKFPLVADPKEEIDTRLGYMSTPTIILADKRGTVLYMHEGIIDDIDAVLEVVRFHAK
ncbi:antioxidant, AhpC/TSA family [delta proteobacterium NaphS2]|nr:antioxidant, AhpC/TSA family [delta proteobacterium NaphS2]